MRKNQWRKLLALVPAVLLAVSAAGAEELPEYGNTETGKEYELVIEVAGPVEVSISHPAEATGAEPVADADRAPAGTFILKEGPDYDVRLDGTGDGTLAYIVARRAAGEDEVCELHRFEDVPVSENTILKTVANAKSRTTLLAFSGEGEGENEKLTVDTAYGSGKNSPNFTVNTQTVLMAEILALVLAALLLLFRKKKIVVILQKEIFRRKG